METLQPSTGSIMFFQFSSDRRVESLHGQRAMKAGLQTINDQEKLRLPEVERHEVANTKHYSK